MTKIRPVRNKNPESPPESLKEQKLKVQSLVEKLRKRIESNPEKSAKILTTWIHKDTKQKKAA